MTVVIERLPTAEFAPTGGDALFVDWLKLLPLFDKLAFVGPTVLVGPKGVGKSLAVSKWAAKTQTHMVTFECSEDVRRAQLYGSFTVRGGETPFILGPIGTAIDIANETGKCILNFEEINALTPQMQKVLNPLTDWRRSLALPEAGKVYKLNPNAKLWVTGSMNHTVYGGVFEFNEDLKSRMRFVNVEYPPPGAEKKVLDEHNKNFKVDDAVVKAAITLATETRSKSYNYALSTRDLVLFLEDVSIVGLEVALWLLAAKFEGSNQETVVKRMQSAFGTKPKSSP